MINTDAQNPKATPPTDSGKAAPEPSQETRKPRGRPFKKSAAPPLTENAVGVENSETPQDAKQTRRPRKPQVDIGLLAKQLKGIHELAANLLPIRTPEGKFLLALSDIEATQLAEGVAAVAKEYDLSLDGKTGAAIQLLSAAVMIYGPRVYFFNKMKAEAMHQAQAEAQARRQADSSIVSNVNVNGHADTAAAN